MKLDVTPDGGSGKGEAIISEGAAGLGMGSARSTTDVSGGGSRKDDSPVPEGAAGLGMGAAQQPTKS